MIDLDHHAEGLRQSLGIRLHWPVTIGKTTYWVYWSRGKRRPWFAAMRHDRPGRFGFGPTPWRARTRGSEPMSDSAAHCTHDWRRDPHRMYPSMPPQHREVCAECGEERLVADDAPEVSDDPRDWPKADHGRG